jgi:hypothetical protein
MAASIITKPEKANRDTGYQYRALYSFFGEPEYEATLPWSSYTKTHNNLVQIAF